MAAASAASVPIRLKTKIVRAADGTLPCEQKDDPPVDSALLAMNRNSDRLGYGCIEKIGADCSCRMEAEEYDQERRHQRTAADSGQANENSNKKSGQRIERVVAGKDWRPLG